MTEAEWLSGTDPVPMLAHLGRKADRRKLRLFACACCRRFWDELTDPRSQRAVEVAERYADGSATLADLRAAGDAASEVLSDLHIDDMIEDGMLSAWQVTNTPAPRAAADTAAAVAHDVGAAERPAELSRQAALLRDAFGNPFRPTAANPDWLTDTVLALARGIYDERAFDRLPILADALEDAGCADAAVLDHCRGPGPRARGCWVVDALLGHK